MRLVSWLLVRSAGRGVLMPCSRIGEKGLTRQGWRPVWIRELSSSDDDEIQVNDKWLKKPSRLKPSFFDNRGDIERLANEDTEKKTAESNTVFEFGKSESLKDVQVDEEANKLKARQTTAEAESEEARAQAEEAMVSAMATLEQKEEQRLLEQVEKIVGKSGAVIPGTSALDPVSGEILKENIVYDGLSKAGDISYDIAKKQYDKRAQLFQTENLQVLPNTVESSRAREDRLTGYRVFRAMAPYIAVHYGSIVVIHVPGEVLESDNAEQVMHDIVLLKTLGIKPVLVAGCRPQIRRKLEQVGKKSLFVQGNRVCDTETLYHCQSVAGHVRLYIESLLTRGLMNSPTGVGSVSVTSGNFVRAIAFGVRGGIDFLHTGIVKKVTAKRIHKLLDDGDVVVLSHLGVSQSGTIYHCRSEDVAVQAAIDLNANKLVFLHNGEGLVDTRKLGGAIVHNLPLNVAQTFSDRLAEELGQSGNERVSHSEVDPKTQWKLQFLDYLQGAIRAVRGGVHRAHLVSRHIEGSIISELCTRDGIGLLISQDLYDGVRPATVHDVPAIKNLIAPLETAKILITRPPKQLEKDIVHFIVFEREGMILACCHLKHYPDARYGNGAVEMSCVAVSAALHGEGIGNALLSYCLRSAFSQKITSLFVLTTRTQGWFIDRGFKEVGPEALPPDKLKTYDYSRNSKVFFKNIDSERAIDEEEILWFKQNKRKEL